MLVYSSRVRKDNTYPIVLPVFSHAFVAHLPYPRNISGGSIGVAIIVLASLRVEIHGHSAANAIIRLVPKLILEILFACIRRVYFRGSILLRSIMPTIRSIMRMLISGLRLDVIRVSVTEIPSLRLGLIFVISIVTVVASNRVTCARLRKRTSIIIRLRGSLMRLALAVVLILMLKFLITLKPRRFALLYVASAILLRIRGGTVARGSSAVSVFL